MSQLNHVGSVLPQNSGLDDDAYQPAIAQPVSQAEIEEFLYGENRPAEERIARLREFREELTARENADLGDDDPHALRAEIDRAIASLEAPAGLGDVAMLDDDPLDHRETLSPDSDELESINEEDEESLEGEVEASLLAPEDRGEEGDGPDSSRGVPRVR